MLTLGVLSIGGIEPSLTIDGANSITVDGGGANQIFDVSTLVYLNDLTITNGFAPNGGAASVIGALRVTNCSFIGNHASSLGGTIYATGEAKLQFTDCIFNSNVASQSGGAIYNGAPQGQLIVTTSTFSSNKASAVSGGAIYNDGSATTINDSTFRTNTANTRGGAIYNTRSLVVTASTFSNNGTAGSTDGGAIGNGPGASTAVVNSTFAGNLGFSGGGTFNSGGVTEIHFCTFSGNFANFGGSHL
jgi:predicted outer membrane repeat protein